MYSKIVSVFLVVLAITHCCTSLQCYSCSGDKFCGENFKAEQAQKIQCGQAAGNYQPACLKKEIRNTQTNQVNVTRKCIIMAAGGNIDNECTVPGGWEKISCVSCTTDECNSAPATNFNIFTALSIATAMFVARGLLH